MRWCRSGLPKKQQVEDGEIGGWGVRGGEPWRRE